MERMCFPLVFDNVTIADLFARFSKIKMKRQQQKTGNVFLNVAFATQNCKYLETCSADWALRNICAVTLSLPFAACTVCVWFVGDFTDVFVWTRVSADLLRDLC